MKANLEANVTFAMRVQPSGEIIYPEESALFSFNQSDSFAKAYMEINGWVDRICAGRQIVSLKVTRLHFQGDLNTREREEEEAIEDV